MVTACYTSLRNGLWGEVTFNIKIRTDVLFLLKPGWTLCIAIDRTFWPKTVPHCLPPELLRNKRALHYLVQEGLGLPIIESFLFRNFIWIIYCLCGSEFASIVKTKYGRYKHKLLVKRLKYFFFLNVFYARQGWIYLINISLIIDKYYYNFN